MSDHFNETDGRFTVRAYSQTNRHGNPQIRLKYWYRGQPVAYQTCPSVQVAIKKANTIWKGHMDGILSAGPDNAPRTVQKLLDGFLARPELSEASKASYKQACGTFVKTVGPDRELHVIGKGAVDRWQAGLTCKQVSKQTYLRNVSALFKWAVKQKFIKADPTADVRVPMGRAAHVLRPYLHQVDWATYLAACDARKQRHHRIRSEFVLHSGLRAGEICHAQWNWIAHGSIAVPASKSARARAIPLDPRALELLEEAKAYWGKSDHIFSKDIIGAGNFQRDTSAACKDAGITVIDFHGLRRSFATNALASGVDLFTLSKWLGHADIATTARHYAGLADSQSRKAMELVASGHQATSELPPKVAQNLNV